MNTCVVAHEPTRGFVLMRTPKSMALLRRMKRVARAAAIALLALTAFSSSVATDRAASLSPRRPRTVNNAASNRARPYDCFRGAPPHRRISLCPRYRKAVEDGLELDIHPIRNDRDHARALKRVEKLWGARPGTRAGGNWKSWRPDRIRTSPSTTPIDPPDPIDAIIFRMEQKGMTRADLVRIIGSRSSGCPKFSTDVAT